MDEHSHLWQMIRYSKRHDNDTMNVIDLFAYGWIYVSQTYIQDFSYKLNNISVCSVIKAGIAVLRAPLTNMV